MPACLFFPLLVVLPLSLFSASAAAAPEWFLMLGNLLLLGCIKFPEIRISGTSLKWPLQNTLKRLIVLSHVRDEKLTSSKLRTFRFTGDL
jgi:hypothetical protein